METPNLKGIWRLYVAVIVLVAVLGYVVIRAVEWIVVHLRWG